MNSERKKHGKTIICSVIIILCLFFLAQGFFWLQEWIYVLRNPRDRMAMSEPVASWGEGGGISMENTHGWILCYSGNLYRYDKDDLSAYRSQSGETFDFVGYLTDHKLPAKHISVRTVDQICDLLDQVDASDLESKRRVTNVGADIPGNSISFYKDGKGYPVLGKGSNLIMVDLEPVLEAIRLLDKRVNIGVDYIMKIVEN